MDQATQDLREMLHMAALLKGAAARAVFQDCAAIFLGVSELLERRAVALAEGQEASPPPIMPVARPRQPLNITA
jgi:ribosomal protein S12 methylthiotransferase accessory factor YcaO